MTLVERARAHESTGHKRLCEGRNYACSCGWDDEVDRLVKELADRIEELEGVLRAVWKDVFEDRGPIHTDTGRKIYAALKENEKGR